MSNNDRVQIKRTNHKWTTKETNRVITLYNLGYTRGQIAQRMGMTPDQIKGRLTYCVLKYGHKLDTKTESVRKRKGVSVLVYTIQNNGSLSPQPVEFNSYTEVALHYKVPSHYTKLDGRNERYLPQVGEHGILIERVIPLPESKIRYK